MNVIISRIFLLLARIVTKRIITKMQTIKRERCVNWEQEEKQIIKNILKPYLHNIENKNLTTNTNKDKIKAWSEVTEKFNLANMRTRNKKQLMNQWKCMKISSKKELSLYRIHSSKTGGGPKPPSPSQDTKNQKPGKDSFNFREASYEDMHRFRVLHNERHQKEHEQRLKQMTEVHQQLMTNLKIQEEILKKILESQNKNM